MIAAAKIMSYSRDKESGASSWRFHRPHPGISEYDLFLISQLAFVRANYLDMFKEDPERVIKVLMLEPDPMLALDVAADVAMEVVDRYGLWSLEAVRSAMSVAAKMQPEFWGGERGQMLRDMWAGALRRIERLAELAGAL